jgi:hypothetical protein
MTLFSPAAVVVSNEPPDPPSTFLSCYNTRVEFPLTASTSNAPLVLQRLLVKIVGENADVLFYTADKTKIDIEDFPKEKHAFDRTFGTTVTKERNQRIVVGFEIRSTIPFRKIKTSVWSYLQDNAIFLKKHPGPLSKMDIVTLGWIHKAHPTFISQSILHTELLQRIQHKLSRLSDDEKENLALQADSKIPDIFFTPGRLSGTYAGGKIDSNVLFLQAERSDAKLVSILIELTFTDSTNMAFIPLALKHSDPTLLGKYLCLQNAFLENHRNISVVGISSYAMDHEQPFADDHEDPISLWNYIHSIPGVLRIDSSRRTPDLGKWNISTTKDQYIDVTQWLDANLEATYHKLHPNAKENCEFPEFPIPLRLSRNTVSHQRRTPGKRSSYTMLLESRLTDAPKVTVVQRTAWRPFQPVVDVSYAFNENEFPPMKSQESIETKSTASTSHMSSLSEQAIKDAINIETAKLTTAARVHATGIDQRIQAIENTLNDLTSNIVRQIYAKLSGPESPFVTVVHLDEKLDRLSQQIEQLCLAATPTPRTIGSPHRKLARITGPADPSMLIDCEPPDPKYE